MSEALGALRERLRGALSDAALRRLAAGSGWLVGSQLSTALVGLAQVALVSRLLGKEGYGSLVLIVAAAFTVRQILSLRVWEWTTTAIAAALEGRDAARGALALKAGLSTSLTIHALAFVGLAACAPWVDAELLKGQGTTAQVLFYATTFLASWVQEPCLSLLRASGHFRYLALQGVALALVRLALSGFALITWSSLEALIGAYVVFEFGAAAWLFAKATRVFRESFAAPVFAVRTPSVWRELLQQRRLLLVGGLQDTLKLVAGKADLLLLGYLTAPSTVGVYQAAHVFIESLNRLVWPVSIVLFSDAAKSAARGDGSALLGLVRRTSWLGAALAAPAALGLFWLGPLVVAYAYGPAYVESGRLLELLALAPVWFVALWMQPVFASIGRPEWNIEVVALALVAKLALMSWLVPRWGAAGLALSTVAYYAASVLLAPFYAWRVRRRVQAPAFEAAAPRPEVAS